jgi:hypothetical protein
MSGSGGRWGEVTGAPPGAGEGRLVVASGAKGAYHRLLHLLGDDGAECMTALTLGELRR